MRCHFARSNESGFTKCARRHVRRDGTPSSMLSGVIGTPSRVIRMTPEFGQILVTRSPTSSISRAPSPATREHCLSLNATTRYFIKTLESHSPRAALHGDAVAAFTRALEIDPACHTAKWDRARSYLYLGNYKQGFADYEIRQVTGQLPPRQLTGELWKGKPYAGKRLLIMVEARLR